MTRPAVIIGAILAVVLSLLICVAVMAQVTDANATYKALNVDWRRDAVEAGTWLWLGIWACVVMGWGLFELLKNRL